MQSRLVCCNVPMPTCDIPVTPNRGFKLKRYTLEKKPLIDSAYTEMRRLHTQGYTHVSNMPCTNFNDVLQFGRLFAIVVRDNRVVSYVARKKIYNKS